MKIGVRGDSAPGTLGIAVFSQVLDTLAPFVFRLEVLRPVQPGLALLFQPRRPHCRHALQLGSRFPATFQSGPKSATAARVMESSACDAGLRLSPCRVNS